MKLKQLHITLIIITFVTIHFSCGKESSCFKSSGEDITEMRNITNNVTSIILEDNIDLIISQDSVASLKIYGGSNLLPYINTEISGNELKIASDNKCSFLRNYKRELIAYISLPAIAQIEVRGQGNVTSSEQLYYSDFSLETRNATGSINLNLNVNNLSIKQHTGPADFTLTGSANVAYYYTGGNGWMHFNSLIANQVHVNNSGSGDVLVNATNNLYVELLSSGNINYYGSPNLVVLSNTGSGKIIKK